MSLTTNQILAAIRRKILEETTDLVTDETALINANLAYDDLKVRTFTNDQIKSATITLTSGVGTLPSDFGTAYGPGYVSTTDQTTFPEKSIMELDQHPDEEGFAIVSGALQVRPTGTTQLIIRYYPSYTTLSTSQDPEINSYFHELIVYGAVWRILEDLQNEAQSEYYKEKYEELLAQKLASYSNYMEDNLSGTMFNGINIIQ